MLRRIAICSFVLSVSAPSVALAQDAKSFWKEILKNCAATDIVKNNLLYVGPTNSMGLGSVWRKAQGNWRPMRELEPLPAGSVAIINQGKLASCTGNATKASSLNPTLILQSAIAPLGVDLGVDLKKAKTTSVLVKGYAWDSLLEGVFSQTLPKLSAAYREDLRRNSVVGRALRVTGITAELSFDNATQATLKAKYTNGIDASGGLKGSWTNQGTLKIETPDTVFLVVEMWKYEEAGFKSAANSHFQVQAIASTDKAAPKGTSVRK